MIERINLYKNPVHPDRGLHLPPGSVIAGMSVFLEGHYKEGRELKKFLDSPVLNALEKVVVDIYKKVVPNGNALTISNTAQRRYLGQVELPRVRLDFSYGQMFEGAIDLQSVRPSNAIYTSILLDMVEELKALNLNVQIDNTLEEPVVGDYSGTSQACVRLPPT